MRLSPAVCNLRLLILLGILSGCSGGEAPPPSDSAPVEAAPAVSSKPVEIDPAGLPELGDYMSGLDGGRIDAAGPEGWVLGSRAKGYAIRFLADDQQQYPMILVSAKDFDDPSGVTAKNVDEFVELVKVADSVSGPVDPISIGRFVGATYQKRGRASQSSSRILERLIVTTVVAGRKYDVELRTREGRLDDVRDQLHAVVNGIRFPDVTGGEDETAAEDGASSDGGEEKPDEETEKEPKEKEKSLDDLLN